MDYKHASLLGNNVPANSTAQERMNEAILRVGGTLHFIIEKSPEGWFCSCKEYPEIITGNTTCEPTDEEIEKSIRDAILCAFDVSVSTPSSYRILSNGNIPSFKF